MLTDLLSILGIIFLIQVVFFLFAAWFKTDKITDLSYGLTFIIAAVFALFVNLENYSTYKLILVVLVSIWGVRLSGYLFYRIIKTGKDKRFDGIREDFFRFASFWSLQAVTVFIVLLPTLYIFLESTSMTFTFLSVIGLIVSSLGIVIEGVADYQKSVFKSREENKGKFISSGLWRYSRHPNYLGEILMWLGIFIYALPYLNGISLLTAISPLFITFLLLKVSGIPTLEKEYEKRYANSSEYLEYKKSTGRLIPKIF